MPRHPVNQSRILACLCAFLAISGCEAGADYQPPTANLPSHWIFQGRLATGDDGTEVSWWENFHDRVLSDLVTRALANNLDLKKTDSRIAEARAARSEAVSALLPDANITADATREANRVALGSAAPPGISKPFDLYQSGFDASWELDLFGENRRRIQSAEALLEASEASRDEARIALTAEIARNYVDIRQYQRQLAILDMTIQSYRHTLDIARKLHDAGATDQLDVIRARAQQEQVETELPVYQNLLSQAELSTDVLLGENPGATRIIVEKVQPVPVADMRVVLAAPATILARRPDIRIAERRLAAATADKSVAVAELFPKLSLAGFIGVLAPQTAGLYTTDNKSWSAGGNLLWPILNYKTIKSDIQVADERRRQAYYDWQGSVLNALSDVEKSLTAYTKEDAHRRALLTAVNDNRRAAEVVRARYQDGLSPFLDVLDAERTLYQSESQLVQSEATASRNLIALYKSLDGGWQEQTSLPAGKEHKHG